MSPSVCLNAQARTLLNDSQCQSFGITIMLGLENTNLAKPRLRTATSKSVEREKREIWFEKRNGKQTASAYNRADIYNYCLSRVETDFPKDQGTNVNKS